MRPNLPPRALERGRNARIVRHGDGDHGRGARACRQLRVRCGAGAVGLTRVVDCGQFNIRVCPGLTFADLARQIAGANPERMRPRETRIPLERGAARRLFPAGMTAETQGGDLP